MFVSTQTLAENAIFYSDGVLLKMDKSLIFLVKTMSEKVLELTGSPTT